MKILVLEVGLFDLGMLGFIGEKWCSFLGVGFILTWVDFRVEFALRVFWKV